VQVRKTAGGWFAAQEIGMRRLTELNPAIASAQGSLVDNITWCDVALFASTTAGIEAMLAGRLAVYVALHDVFEADPLLGHDGAFARCEDEHHLADALARARGLTDGEYDAALHRQRALAERILAPIDIQQLLVRLAPAAGTTVAADRSAEPSRVHA